MAIIIELSGRNSAHEFQRFPADKITIGRALDNDLILTDPHVDAHHAVLEVNESGEPMLSDLGSVNGSIVKKEKFESASRSFLSGDEIVLGKTRLRVYTPEHEVPAAIQLNWVEKIAQLANNPLFTAGLCLLLMSFTLYTQYTKELSTFYIGRELLTAIGVLLAFALWPAAWSLFARYKKHEARFLAQLSTTIVFIILVSLIEKLNSWLAFHNGASVAINSVTLTVIFVMLLLVIWFHYYLSIFLNRKRRWLYSGLMTGLFAGIIYIGSSIDNDRFNSRPEYTAKLFPASVSFYSGEAIEGFLNDAEQIFNKASDSMLEED